MKKIRLLFGSRFLIRRLQARFIIKETSNIEADTVLDIGVGKAPYKKFIRCRKYLGLDIEDRGGVKDVIIADINDGIPLKDASVDLVLFTEVLEHIKEPARALREINRVLKPEGKLIMTTPFAWLVHEAPNDFYRYTRFGLEHLLKGSGFHKIEIRASNSYLYTIFQLLNANLRNKLFIPLVFLFNISGLILKEISKNKDFPLNYYVVTSK